MELDARMKARIAAREIANSLLALVAVVAIAFGVVEGKVFVEKASASQTGLTGTVIAQVEEKAGQPPQVEAAEVGDEAVEDAAAGEQPAEAALADAAPAVDAAEGGEPSGLAASLEVPQIHFLDARAHGHSQAEIDAGGIVEYEDGWYCAHNYDAGALFYEFDPGDLVLIDGRSIVIEGSEYYNYNYDTLEGVRGQLGYDVVLFQTCVDGMAPGTVIIYYGHETHGEDSFGIWG